MRCGCRRELLQVRPDVFVPQPALSGLTLQPAVVLTGSVFAICSVFEAELADHIPVVKTSVAGTRLVGRVTVGMQARCVAS